MTFHPQVCPRSLNSGLIVRMRLIFFCGSQRVRPVRASVVERYEQHGSDKPLEVLRLRATSAVTRDKSVRRSAQDDEFVGGHEKHPKQISARIEADKC
jgi:hypothetical protein